MSTATVKPRWWENETSSPTTKVTLIPWKEYDGTWEVQHDGKVLGRVERYEGSHDRQIAGTRLRHPGVRKTLWAATTLDGRTDYYREHDSRADALRVLLRAAGVHR